MERRRFLGLTFLAPGWLVAGKLGGHVLRACTAPREISFYVAGARFYPNGSVKTGEPVRIERAMFNGKPCYPIYALDGSQIGYLPKPLVPELHSIQTRQARVSRADRFAVPWKRYEVTLVLA